MKSRKMGFKNIHALVHAHVNNDDDDDGGGDGSGGGEFYILNMWLTQYNGAVMPLFLNEKFSVNSKIQNKLQRQ